MSSISSSMLMSNIGGSVNTKLPHIIGSRVFYNDTYMGIINLNIYFKLLVVT